ncbi:MAG: hypothetical protein WCY90_00670 [Bacilli bacterium]
MKTETPFKPGELFTAMRMPLTEFGLDDYEVAFSESDKIAYTFN